ncbi:rhodanese-like domain-containing protein [Salarchaeum japonicum]|uniref:Rhodanese-like domain-containing protein n=1 Tax=Salarchaeum japonicum TaxID=555573 RepID=A0AAV3T4I1_9EURY|nr:rhodanese-like domain-containing protein [Salarchaeum japonicum]
MPATTTPDELAALLDADADAAILDTRPPESFDAWHLPGAANVPYKPNQPFPADALPDGLDTTDRVLTICAKGTSSRFLAEELDAAGYRDVSVVAGGMRDWSAVYETVPVVARSDLEIVQVQRRAKGCLGYVVADPRTEEAAVVDPTRHTERFRALADARDWEVVRVLDTHVHADHVSGGRRLADALDVPYHLGANARERDVTYEYEEIARNETVSVGGVSLKAVPTPGHTTDLTSYLVADAAVLTGDALFTDSVGRTELEFGDADADRGARLQHESLQRTLLALPDSLAVLPGHASVAADGTWSPTPPGQPVKARVGALRDRLPLLSLSEDAFVERLTASAPAKPPNYERVIAINRGRETVENETELTELELGPNNCAID